LDVHIERLEAKLAFLERLADPGRDLRTVIEEIDYAMDQRRNLERLRQMGVVRYSTPQKFTNVNGYTIRYLEYAPPEGKSADSNKEVLILLHGIGASAERWSHVIPTLSRHFRVIIPDIIGFGYSDKPPAPVEYTMDFFINDFFRPFLNNLHITKASIIGSSFGGHVATEFAIRFNHMVEKLVLVSPAGIMKKTSTPTLDRYIWAALYPEHNDVYNAFREMVYNSNAVNEGMVRDFINRMSLTHAKYAFMSTLREIGYAPTLPGRLSNITAPTLLVWGHNDKMMPIKYSTDFIDEIPNISSVVINKCGHTPYVEKPITFNEIILEYLCM
jgi:2-hydroxy-6-oxonona-2,4-dienedioate hydrolase